MMVGTYDAWTPVEHREWDKDLEKMWTKHEQTEREMYPENKENLHWMELALDDPLFKVSYTQIFGSNLYVVDVTQKPPSKKGVRNMDFEIVYPIYHGLNDIIELTKPSKTSQIKIKVSSREHWDVVYTCEFRVDRWSYNKMDEIIEGLADQLTMKQDLNGGLLIQLSFNEEE